MDPPSAWVNTKPFVLLDLARVAVTNHKASGKSTIATEDCTLMLSNEGDVVRATATYLLQPVNSAILELYLHLIGRLSCSSEERTNGTPLDVVWKMWNSKKGRFVHVAVLELMTFMP